MKYSQSNAEIYYGLSIHYYENYKNKLSELYAFADNKSYKVIKTPEDEMKYKVLFHDSREYLYISIVFNAFAIEAFINLVGVTVFGNEVFFSEIERKNTFPKIRLIFHELKDDFDKHTEVKELIELAFDLRHKLAHSKSKQLDLIDIQNDIYHKFSPENLGKYTYEDIFDPFEELNWLANNVDTSLVAYQKFKELTNKILGYDIFAKQAESLQRSIDYNVQEMIKKGVQFNPRNT